MDARNDPRNPAFDYVAFFGKMEISVSRGLAGVRQALVWVVSVLKGQVWFGGKDVAVFGYVAALFGWWMAERRG